MPERKHRGKELNKMDEKNTNQNGTQEEAKQELDRQMTLNVQNEGVEKAVDTYLEERTNENLSRLINELCRCRLLVPAVVNEENKPFPLTITSKDQTQKFIPVYTSVTQIPKEPKIPGILNLPYLVINNMAANEKADLDGIVINPFTQNLVFQKPLTVKIKANLEALSKKKGPKPVQVTEQQYNMLARKHYEFNFLPKKFFEGGQAFMDELCEKKEELIDALYEESYQEKRLYPYLPEDFSVMIMDISEELLIVRVDFPEQNMSVPSCYRIYMTWNTKEQTGRFFTVEKTKDAEAKLLGEMDAKIKHVSHGEAPVEGAELQAVIDLHKENQHSA